MALQWLIKRSPSIPHRSRRCHRRRRRQQQQQQQQQHPFDALPEELTLEILARLDTLSLYRASQTSSRYRALIAQRIDLWTALWFDPELPLRRRELYRTLCFLVEHHGLHEHVRAARFDRCSIDSATLERVLRYLPRLSALSVVGCPRLDCFQLLSMLRHTAPASDHRRSLPPSGLLAGGPLLQHLTRLEIRGLFPSERGIMSYAHEIYCYASIRRLLAKNTIAAAAASPTARALRRQQRRQQHHRHYRARVLEGLDDDDDDDNDQDHHHHHHHQAQDHEGQDDDDDDDDDDEEDLLLYHQFWLLLQQPLFRASPELLVLPSTAVTFSALSTITTATTSTVNSNSNSNKRAPGRRRSIEMDVQPCSHCHRNVTHPTPAPCAACGEHTLTPCAQCMCYHCRTVLCRSCFIRQRRGWRVLRCQQCQLARRVCNDAECLASLYHDNSLPHPPRPWLRRRQRLQSDVAPVPDFYCAWCKQKKTQMQRLPWIRRMLWPPNKNQSPISTRPPLYLN